MKRILLSGLLLVLALTVAFAQGDELEDETTCQQCIEQAWTDWQACINIVQGDEGDWHCRGERENQIRECQLGVCNQ